MTEFLLKDIDDDEVERVYDQLNEDMEDFQELHDRNQQYAEFSIEAELYKAKAE